MPNVVRREIFDTDEQNEKTVAFIDVLTRARVALRMGDSDIPCISGV